MNDFHEPQDGRALPIEEALRYAISLAELLRQMHRDGTVCGRLERKNIAWDNHSVKLLQDEGAATGAYLSPEQVSGEAADARSDIFAFGAIIYELLCGRRAFPADEPGELRKQILELSPPLIDGFPEGLVSLLRGCLEKNRELRWQRMHPILVELKLANASLRQAHSVSDWRERVVSLRSHVEDHDQRLAAQQTLQSSMADELRQSIQRIEYTLAMLQESITGLQKNSQIQAKAVEGLQMAASQTDEVVEHVVEAFGMMHRSLVERGDSKILLVSTNGA